MILDSSYLFDLMASDEAAFRTGVDLVERGEMQWLPTPVIAEAFYGARTARSDTTSAEVRNRLLGYPRIAVDEEVTRTAGTLLAAADDAAEGESGIGLQDAYVGAMAEILDDAVLTANLGAFEALGVQVESYADG